MLLNSFSDFFTYLRFMFSGDSASIIKLKELKRLFKTFKTSKYRYITKEKKITNLFIQKLYQLQINLNCFKTILDTTLFSNDEKRAQIFLNYFVESNLQDSIFFCVSSIELESLSTK